MMQLRDKKQNIFKRFCDARWAWDMIQGPVYNRLIYNAADTMYQRFISEVQPADNSKILDVGSGPGFITVQLAEGNPTIFVIGIDYSSTEIKAANRLLRRTKIENCQFRQANAMDLPFADGSFDGVVSAASIKHWPDAKRGLLEIKRVLKPSGYAFIGDADQGAPIDEIKKFANRFTSWYTYRPFIRWYAKNVVFGKSYKAEEVAVMALDAGFKDAVVNKILDWPFFIIRLRK